MNQTVSISTLKETVKELEPILEVIPDDITTLHSLILAYEQLGEGDKAMDKAIQLSHVLQDRNEWNTLKSYCEQYRDLNPENPVYTEFINMAQMFLGDESTTNETETPSAFDAADPGLDISVLQDHAMQMDHELELGWSLVDKELITESHYENCLQSLTESRSNPNNAHPHAFLSELAGEDLVNMERVLSDLSKTYSTPFIRISHARIPEENHKALPADICKQLGILPFGQMGGELMIATLNPSDMMLRELLPQYLNKPVHFYLTDPQEMIDYYLNLESE